MKGSQICAALLLLPSVMSHICVWQPMQRGDFSIATPASHDCYRKVGPCGGEDAGTTITNLQGGSSYEVQFQQNLNHYSTDDPGSLVVDYALNSNPSEEDFISLDTDDITDYNAMNMITQTNFTYVITVPNTDADAAVLRVRYISNNPEENDRGEIFYQCSDITISSSSSSNEINNDIKQQPKQDKEDLSIFTLDVVATKKHKESDDSMGCCAPSAFMINYDETNPTGSGIIWYSKDAQMIRVDFGTEDSSHSMYSNFTSGIEWYVDNTDGTCVEYGCDLWIDWCFGMEGYSETYVGSGECGDPVNADCNAYVNGGWTFTATSDDCFPAGLEATAPGYGPRNITYYDPVAMDIPSGLFYAPCSVSSASGGKSTAPAHLSAVHATMHAHKTALGLN